MQILYDKTKTLNQMLKDMEDFNQKEITRIMIGSQYNIVDFA
ncbi:MAG: hypothetical protein ACTSXD_07045 [Candidatus Heimdallarchaeaceae archaeon]